MPVSRENFNLDGAQTERWIFHYLDTQPFHEVMSRNGQEGLGWPSQWVEPLFIPPILTAPPTISPHERFELPSTRATIPSTQPPAKKLTQATHQLLLPFQENQLRKLAPLAHAFQREKDRSLLLKMSSDFIHHIYQAPQLYNNYARLNRSSEGLPRNKLPKPMQKHIGEKKNKGWVGQAQAWLASTHKKTSVTSRQATNNVLAKHQTYSPRDAPQSPTLQLKPNQLEPKKKTPAINDHTVGSPTVTLLQLRLNSDNVTINDLTLHQIIQSVGAMGGVYKG